MRTLLHLALLTLALAACASTKFSAQLATAWAPPTGVASIECAMDDDAVSDPSLEAACQADSACGCAQLGHALLMSSGGAVEARALEVLEGACQRGVLRSCDETAMIEELCVRGTARPSSACGVLARQGRVGSAEMQPR